MDETPATVESIQQLGAMELDTMDEWYAKFMYKYKVMGKIENSAFVELEELEAKKKSAAADKAANTSTSTGSTSATASDANTKPTPDAKTSSQSTEKSVAAPTGPANPQNETQRQATTKDRSATKVCFMICSIH